MATTYQIPAPNYTQIPNVIFDYWMNVLSSSAFKVLMCICRKTFGWHKTSDEISKSQIVELTGLSKNTTTVSVEELEKHQLIFKESRKNGNVHDVNTYFLNIHKPEFGIGVTQNLDKGRSEIDPGVGQKLTQGVDQILTPQKKDLQKKEEDPPLTPPLKISPRDKAFNATIERWEREDRSTEIIRRVKECYYQQPKGKVLKIQAWLESVYAQKQEEYEMEPVYSARRRFVESRSNNYSLKDDEVTYTSGSCEQKISLRGSESFWKNHNLDTETILNKRREKKTQTPRAEGNKKASMPGLC